MAETITNRPVLVPPIPRAAEVVVTQKTFFSPPRGVDVTTPLIKLPPEFSPQILNMYLDRGILRSRNGTEAYHNGVSGKKLQHTVDIKAAGGTSTTYTARTTANQGVTNGWTIAAGNVSGESGETFLADNLKPLVKVGDPTVDANVDAYDDNYSFTFSVTSDHGSVPEGWTAAAEVTVELSTNGGGAWSTVSGVFSAISTSAVHGHPLNIVTKTYTVTVVATGTPTQVWFRLKLRNLVQGPSGTSHSSVSAGQPVTWVTSAGLTTPARLPMRWTEDKIQFYDDPTDQLGPWTDYYSFPANQLNNDQILPTFVIWNTTIVSTDVGNVPQSGSGTRWGSKGLVSTIMATPHTTSILPKSPRAASLFILGNRVIAVRTNDWTTTTDPWVDGSITYLSRIRWCAKNDTTKWDETVDIGSGHEDFLASSGTTDEVMAGAPVTDETGILVFDHTIRRMDVTGFSDAPFRFGILHESLGSPSRYTIAGLPGGVILLGYDDVHLVTLGDARRLGTAALRDSLKLISNRVLATGYFDVFNSRYLVAWKEGSQQVVWAYSFFDQGWTKFTLPYDVVFIDHTYFTSGNDIFHGAYFTQAATSGYSARENQNRVQDVTTAGTDTDTMIEVRTGIVLARNSLYKTQVVEVQLEFEADAPQLVAIEYSTDGGDTWNGYGTLSVPITTRPTVVATRKTFTDDQIQLRATSTNLGKLKLIALHAFVVPGPRIKP